MSEQRKHRINPFIKNVALLLCGFYLAGGRLAWIGETPWSKRPLSPVITGEMASVAHGDWLSQLSPSN